MSLFSQIGEHGVGGGGGFEADGEVDDLLVWIFAGDVDGLQGRANHADVGAVGFGGEKVALGGGGHAKQIAEGAENHVGATGDFDGVVEIGGGGDANGAAGTVKKLDVRREERVERIA